MHFTKRPIVYYYTEGQLNNLILKPLCGTYIETTRPTKTIHSLS